MLHVNPGTCLGYFSLGDLLNFGRFSHLPCSEREGRIEGERERETETETETDRQTETERQRKGETERRKDRETHTERQRAKTK